MLRLENIHLNYGRIQALRGISLEVPAGKVVSLLGPNGAGKSSVLKVISGLLAPADGKLMLQGRTIERRSCSFMVKSGIILCPEGRRVFPEFTVLENLRIGAYQRQKGSGVEADLDRIFDYFPRLKERSPKSEYPQRR